MTVTVSRCDLGWDVRQAVPPVGRAARNRAERDRLCRPDQGSAVPAVPPASGLAGAVGGQERRCAWRARGSTTSSTCPPAKAALTRRAKKASRISAVVVRFSRSRRRYEHPGVLVEEDALARAEQECLADEDARRLRQEHEPNAALRPTSTSRRRSDARSEGCSRAAHPPGPKPSPATPRAQGRRTHPPYGSRPRLDPEAITAVAMTTRTPIRCARWWSARSRSSHLTVVGELVAIHVDTRVRDRSLGSWRGAAQ